MTGSRGFLFVVIPFRGGVMNKINHLLTGNFWIIDKNMINFSTDELEFLKYFFEIKYECDFEKEEPKEFLILKKKSKFLPVH